jgi:oxygen-dependent protoporphyrinogen oxidase
MPKVIVVGAGVAGLGAAYRLKQRGFEVQVLEAEDTPGGRMRSERHGGFVVERGAQFIASSYRNMRRLAAELGIDGEIEKLSDTRNAVLRRGRFQLTEYEGLRAFVRSKDLSLGAKLRLLKLLPAVIRHGKELNFYRPERSWRLDNESAADYVRRTFGDEVLDYMIEPAFAGTFTVLPENMSKAFMLSTIATLFGGFRLLNFRGGNGSFTTALARQLDVRTNTPVERIEPGPHRVGVILESGELLGADAVVVAVPGNAAGGICSDLTPSERRFLSSVRYASSIIAFVMAGEEALPPFYGAGFTRRERVRLYGMAVENAKSGVVPAAKTLFNCAFAEDLAVELMDAPDADVIEALNAELRKLPLKGLDTIDGYVIHRWPALVPRFWPGYHRSIRDFLRRGDRTRRLFFAGDYLVGPYTEAALTSGLRAARDVTRFFESGEVC